MPEVIDDEGDNFRINVYLSDTKNFTNMTPSYELKFKPAIGDSGEYQIKIVLLDFNFQPKY